MGDDFEECVLNCCLGHSDIRDMGLETADALQSRFAGEGRLSGGLFKETIETCVTTAATGRVICALAAHFLFSTGIAGAGNAVESLWLHVWFL
jgi:hypothetical protein